MCLECSGKHRGLNVHISFIRSYEIPKETDIVAKYNINAASIYQNWIQAIAEGRPWRDPPIVKENLGGSGWDNDDGFRSSGDIRQNQSTGNVRAVSGGGVGVTRRGMSVHSKSNEDIYTGSQLETLAANTESFFSRKMQENDSQPEGLPPSQGSKYVWFGSAPAPSQRNTNAQGDVFSVVSQDLGRLSLVATSTAQSAATVVQVGTKEIISKMFHYIWILVVWLLCFKLLLLVQFEMKLCSWVISRCNEAEGTQQPF
ncbi:hypothetical protein UlMin_036514 [Ulmus minor]